MGGVKNLKPDMYIVLVAGQIKFGYAEIIPSLMARRVRPVTSEMPSFFFRLVQ
jgi:hypothetical protein